MTIFIDADACPVVEITVVAAKKRNIPVVLLCDTNHIMSAGYAKVITVDQGSDSVDYALVNLCGKGDIVVTQDYGVAAMALSKGSRVIHQSGLIYSDANIDGLLDNRYLAGKARRSSSKCHFKGPKKRTPEDDESYKKSLLSLLEES